MTSAAVGAPGSARRYFHSLGLLSARDLRVRYATSALGYLWSVLDPLVMSAIYWFVFTQVFQRTVGHEPYIVFLITALLPWVWFNAAVTDFTRAFKKDARLVRSTAIPRSIWVNRIVASKGIEFLFSLPVLALFAVVTGATVGWGILLFPVAVILQTMLLVGIGLIVAPLCVLFSDLERTTRLVLRVLFYASPIIYGVGDLPGGENVRLTAGLHGMPKAEVSRRFDDIIAFAELADFVDTPYKHLSNGMKVRLAFSVVSQLDEPILLVDEVLAVGDKAFREKCYRRIDELLAEGRTLFFVSHNERDLRRFCRRGLYLDRGRLVLDAPIAEVLERYNADSAAA